MVTRQFLGYTAATFERHILDLEVIGFIEESRQQLIFLALAGAGHEPITACGSGCSHELVNVGNTRVDVDPQKEGILSHAPDRCKSRDVYIQFRLTQRCGVKTVERHHHGVVVALLALHMNERLCTRTTWFVDRDKRFG